MTGTNSPQGGLTRRSFLKTTAAVAGATALAGGAGLTALADSAPAADAGEQVFVGRCNYPGCFGCERNVVVRDGHVVNMKPRPEAPYGRRPCAKGYSLMQRLYSDQRTMYPLKRAEGSERGDGQWERISWDEAISTVCQKFMEYQAQYGSYSLLFYGGPAGADMVHITIRQRLTGSLMVTTQDGCADWAIYHGVHRVLGNPQSGNMTFCAWEPFEEDVCNAKNFIVWGKNPCNSYPQRWRYILDAHDQGTRLYAVDPNVTQAALRADKWFKVRPASDLALVLALMQVIFEEGLQDDEFLKTQTVAPLLVREDNGKFLRMSDLGVEPIAGPPDMYGVPTFIDAPAAWDLDANKPGSSAEIVNPAMEGSFEVNGIKVTCALTLLKERVAQYPPEKMSELVEMSPEDIRELARICADGPVMHMYGMGFQHYDNGLHLGMALATLQAITGNLNKRGAGMVNDSVAAPFNYGLLLAPAFTFANTVPLMSIPEIIKTGQFKGMPYPIKAAYITASTAPMGNTNAVEFLDAIRSLEFVVVQDVTMSPAVTMLADIVLPACHPFERDMIHYAHIEQELPYAPKMVEPAFEALSDTEILIRIAKGMGLGDVFPENDVDALNQTLLAEPYLSMGISIDTLRQNHTMRYAPKGFLYAAGFPTGTGRVEFYSESPQARMDLGLELDYSNQHMADLTFPVEAWPGTKAMDKYPLVFMYQRNPFRFHGTGNDGAWANELEKEPIARINAADAAARGIESGSLVEFYNERGYVVMRTFVDAGVRSGIVIYDSKGLRPDQYVAGDPALLMQNHIDPFAVNQSFFDCTAEMRPWNEGR